MDRRRAGVKTSLVAGSIWESRMKLDQVKGGIKVFNGETNNASNGDGDCSSGDGSSSRKLVKRSPVGKRKTWKSESIDGPIQIGKGRSDSSSISKNVEELSVSVDGGNKKSSSRRGGRSDNKGLSVSVDGIFRSPIAENKVRSQVGDDENERNPVRIRKVRSDVKEVVESAGEKLRKVKSDCVRKGDNDSVDNGIEKISVKEMIEKAKSECDNVLDESVDNNISGGGDGDDSTGGRTEKNLLEIHENGCQESCKELGVCQEKAIYSKSEDNGETTMDNQDDQEEEEEQQEQEKEEMDIEIAVEKKSVDIMEIINIPEEKPETKVETKAPPSPPPPPRSPLSPQEQKPNNHKKVEFSTAEQNRSKKVEGGMKEENNKLNQFRNRASPPISSTVLKQQPFVTRRAAVYQNHLKPTSIPVVNSHQKFPESHNKLQNIVDLVMWRDISRSAFIFGIGSFIIISSSYTKDLNVSFISVMSYVGLVYLAIIFLYRTLIARGGTDIEETRYVVGEEEAVWLLKLFLPYLNECLLKIKALFSGDPATTMKMAVLLFVFARCGSSFTIWKMAKLGFFGVFSVPKICSSYSAQLTAYAKFWMRRFRDAWESCSHKKAVALAIFTLVWNLSSMAARVWAVFMMYVAIRYYQQSMVIDEEDWVEDDAEDNGETETLIAHKQEIGGGPTSLQVNKDKKIGLK